MATATTATIWSNSSDANFRAWGSWISGLFTTFGWVNVSQVFATGTNWTDVTAPAAANTARVTEIWRMADAAQATSPLYLEISYGEGAVADSPALRIRLGTGNTGATLDGMFYDTSATYFAATLNTNSMTHFASGDTGRISFAMAVSGTSWAAGNVMGFGIERRINSTGAAQTTGWLFYKYNGASTRNSIAWDDTYASALGATALGSMPFPVALAAEANLTWDGKQNVSPLAYVGVGPMEVGLNMVCVPASAYGAGGTFSVTIFGSSHTYVTIGEMGNLSIMAGSAAVLEAAMRYE